MNDINFINAPSTHNQRDTHRWLLISSVLFCITALVIGSKQLRQLWNLIHAHSACSSAEQQSCAHKQCLETHRTYAEQIRSMTKKRDHLLALHTSLTQTAQCIQDITHNRYNSTLKHCSITKKTMKVSLHIPQTEYSTSITHALSQTEWAQQVMLESITTTQSNDTTIALTIALKS